MAYTQAQLDALINVISSGVNSSGYGDKRVDFRSLAELREIMNDMQTQLSGSSRLRQIRIVSPSEKGL